MTDPAHLICRYLLPATKQLVYHRRRNMRTLPFRCWLCGKHLDWDKDNQTVMLEIAAAPSTELLLLQNK